MARSLEEFDPQTLSRPDDLLDPRRLEKSAARAIALAIASLLVTSLVVTSSVSALVPDRTAVGTVVDGTIKLLDDDQGRSTVDLAELAPGRPVVECISVEYTGSKLPVDLKLAASADGPPANNIWVEIERGKGGGFGSCGGFRPATMYRTGTLAGIVGRESMTVASFVNPPEPVTFRFRFDVLDEGVANGIPTATEFMWAVVPR